jgi:hypothetical protein
VVELRTFLCISFYALDAIAFKLDSAKHFALSPRTSLAFACEGLLVSMKQLAQNRRPLPQRGHPFKYEYQQQRLPHHRQSQQSPPQQQQQRQSDQAEQKQLLQQQQGLSQQRHRVGYMRNVEEPMVVTPLMTSSRVFVDRVDPLHVRNATLDDRFLAPERPMSHQHAIVEITDDGTVTVTDLESHHGSFQVKALSNDALQPGVKYTVGNRDVFYFGSCPVLFIIEAAHVTEVAHAVDAADALAVDILSDAGSPSTCSNSFHIVHPKQPHFCQNQEAYHSFSNTASLSDAFVVKDTPSSGTFPTQPYKLPDYIGQCTSNAQGFAKYLKDKTRQEQIQRLIRFIVLATDFVSVLLASMLSLLVPQECGRLDERRMCTIEENVDWYSTLSVNCSYNLPANAHVPKGQGDCFTRFNQFVLCWNILLVACFAVLYSLENKREAWLGKYLDAEPNEIRDNLVHTKFWGVRGHQCAVLTRRLFYCYLVTFIVYMLNVVFSAMMILPKRNDAVEELIRYNDGQGGYYLDYRTLTVFYAYALPLFFKMAKGTYLLILIRIKKPTPLSIFGWHVAELQPLSPGSSTVDFEPVSFNVVAPEVCLKELGAADDLVGTWQLMNPDGRRCPHVSRIPPSESCHCATGKTLGADATQRGLIPSFFQGSSRLGFL